MNEKQILKSFEGRDLFSICFGFITYEARYEIEHREAIWLNSLADDLRDSQEVSEETEELYEEYKEYKEKKKKELKDKYDIYI